MVRGAEKYFGKSIRVTKIDDPSLEGVVLEGMVMKVDEDIWGDMYFIGSWGRTLVYPDRDEFEFVSDPEVVDSVED